MIENNKVIFFDTSTTVAALCQYVESDIEAYCSVGVVSNVRAGTKTLTYTKSNESQKLRDPTDESFKYAAVTPQVKPVWAGGSGFQNRSLR